MNYTKLKIFTTFAAVALMVAMFGHTQQAKGISQSQGSSVVCINDECMQSKDTQGSVVCINDECDVNFSSSPSSIRDNIEEEKEDMNESIEESFEAND